MDAKKIIHGGFLMPNASATAKKRSALVTVFLPTFIFLVFFIGAPVTAVRLTDNPGGFTVFIGLLLGLVLGLVVSVITYRKVYALSDYSEEKLFFRGSSLIKQSGRKEMAIDLSRDHITEIDAGTSQTGSVITTIEVREGKKNIRIAGMNYSYESAVQKFPDGQYFGNFPVSPYEGMSAGELDAGNPEAMSFMDALLSLLWEQRNLDAGYRYYRSLPWSEEIRPQFSAVRVIQGEAAYRENIPLIEQIKNSAFYTVEESYNYLFINRDYLMICPGKKIDMKLKSRIIPFGVFTMRFKKEFRSAPRGSGDHWEYIEIQGIDENENPHEEKVAFSIYHMNDYYKAKIIKRYLLMRNLVKEK